MILVEDSDIGGPSLITIRMEYLLCNSDVVNLVWESNEGEAGSIDCRCFDCRWVRVGGTESLIRTFIPDVTQAKEDAELVEDLILVFFCVDQDN